MLVPLLAAGLGMGLALAAKKSKPAAPAPGGGTVPAGSSGPGSGHGTAPGPGAGTDLPAAGVAYQPDRRVPQVVGAAFGGRDWVRSLHARETSGDAPPERHAHLMERLAAGKVDAPVWRRIPVRNGLEVEVSHDIMSSGGVRLCGPIASHQAIADAFGAMIPTAGIVDAIHAAANVKIEPQPVGWKLPPDGWHNPGGGARWWLYFADRVEEEVRQGLIAKFKREGMFQTPALISGLSKDYVLHSQLSEAKTQIYGWIWPDGTVIQSGGSGVSEKHHFEYYDYSHGFRLVRRLAWLSGHQVDLADIYQKRPELVSFRGAKVGPIPVRHPRTKPLTFPV